MSPSVPLSTVALIRVAEAFGPLLADVVFLGGAVLPLLLTDPAAHPARGTDDVDVVVEVQSRKEFYAFETELRTRGFTNDSSEGAPVPLDRGGNQGGRHAR